MSDNKQTCGISLITVTFSSVWSLLLLETSSNIDDSSGSSIRLVAGIVKHLGQPEYYLEKHGHMR